jgi:hypothetical protein
MRPWRSGAALAKLEEYGHLTRHGDARHRVDAYNTGEVCVCAFRAAVRYRRNNAGGSGRGLIRLQTTTRVHGSFQ